jgi:hypothetical protein
LAACRESTPSEVLAAVVAHELAHCLIAASIVSGIGSPGTSSRPCTDDALTTLRALYQTAGHDSDESLACALAHQWGYPHSVFNRWLLKATPLQEITLQKSVIIKGGQDMTTSQSDSLVNQLQETYTKARQEYAEILRRSSSPKKGDLERIAVILPMIGVTADDLAKDREILASVLEQEAQAQKQIDSIPQTEKAMLKAVEDEKRIHAECHDIIRKAYQRMNEAPEAVTRTYTADAQARSAEDQLRRLRATHPRLFGLPAPRNVEAHHHQKNYLHGEKVIQE